MHKLMPVFAFGGIRSEIGARVKIRGFIHILFMEISSWLCYNQDTEESCRSESKVKICIKKLTGMR